MTKTIPCEKHPESGLCAQCISSLIQYVHYNGNLCNSLTTLGLFTTAGTLGSGGQDSETLG